MLGERKDLLGTNLDELLLLLVGQAQLDSLVDGHNRLDLEGANFMGTPLDMLLAFALFGKASDVDGLVLPELENDNGLHVPLTVSNYWILKGNDRLLMVDRTLD